MDSLVKGAGPWAGAVIGVIAVLAILNPGLYDRSWRWKRNTPLRSPQPTLPFAATDALAFEVSEPLSQFRNDPGRTGETAERIRFPLKKSWHVPGLNQGFHTASKSSPAIDDSGIYVGTDAGVFYGLSLSGEVRWTYTVALTRQGIHATPLTDSQTVYFGAYNGYFYALDKSTGQPRWTIRLGGAIGSSATLEDGSIYVAVESVKVPNGFVARLDARTGRIQWLSPWLGAHAHSSPALTRDPDLVIVGANNGKVFGLDSATGRIRWTAIGNGPFKATPLVVENWVFIGSWDHNLYRIDRATGQVAGRYPLGARSQASAALVKHRRLLITATNGGDVVALRWDNGHEVWRRRFEGPILSSPTVARRADRPDKAVVIVGCGAQAACALDVDGGATLQKFDIGGQLTSSAALFKGQLVLSADAPGELSLWK